MKKTNKLLVFVLLVMVLFSLSALAAIPNTPGDFLRSFSDFFRGLFTGTATMDQAYIISFILYFILFLAVFLEGLRVVPFFGEKGNLNKQGKVFAVAASALATIAIFMVDRLSGVSTGDRISWLLAPFGIWGGLILAIIIALVTYHLIKGSAAFSDSTMTAMAIAAAVGITFAGFLLGLENLLGWGFLLMLVTFIVGAIKAYTKHRGEARPEREKEREELVKKEVERYKKEDEERKKKEDHKRRKSLLRPAKGGIIGVVEAIDDLAEGLGKRSGPGLAKARNSVDKMEGNLRLARNCVRKAWREADHTKRKWLQELRAYIETIEETVGNQIKNEIPTSVTDPDWGLKIMRITAVIPTIRTRCSYILDAIDRFIDEDKTEALKPFSPPLNSS